MTATSDQLQVVVFGIVAPFAVMVVAAAVVFVTGIRLHLRDVRERRAAKRARLDVSDRRYRERLAARNSRPSAGVLHIDQRRATR